jgi:hypothetical protein
MKMHIIRPEPARPSETSERYFRRSGKSYAKLAEAGRRHLVSAQKRTPELAKDVHYRFTGVPRGINVRADQMLWPKDDEPARTRRYCGNNFYRDLRGKTWLMAERALQVEEELISAADELCRRGGGDGGDAQALYVRVTQAESALERLDLGTIGAVHAISAAGGIPISSCNAGSFGGAHGEAFPVVCFLWRPERLPILRACAKEAGVSMWLHRRGEVVIGADYIRRFLMFAQAVLDRRQRIEDMEAVRVSREERAVGDLGFGETPEGRAS